MRRLHRQTTKRNEKSLYVYVLQQSDEGANRRDERRDQANPPQGLQHQAVGLWRLFSFHVCTFDRAGAGVWRRI